MMYCQQKRYQLYLNLIKKIIVDRVISLCTSMKIGDQVKIYGLSNEKCLQYNALQGIIKKYFKKKDRYQVKMTVNDETKILGIKDVNLARDFTCQQPY